MRHMTSIVGSRANAVNADVIGNTVWHLNGHLRPISPGPLMDAREKTGTALQQTRAAGSDESDHVRRRLKLIRMAIAHAHARTHATSAMSILEAKKGTTQRRYSKET
jgi:hypothetical protein